MRLFGLFANLWRGFVSIFIADAAVAFPEATYRGQIQEAKETHEALLNAAGMIKGNLIENKRVLDVTLRKLAETEAKLKAAVNNAAGGSDKMREAGALLARQKTQLEKQRDEQLPIVRGLESDAEKAKRKLRQSEAHVKDLRNRMATNLARLKSAEQRERMQNLLSGISVEGGQEALTALEAAIDQKVGRVELQDEIAAGSVEQQLEELEEQAGDVVAMDEFDRLVAEKRQQQGVATAATPSPDGGGKQA